MATGIRLPSSRVQLFFLYILLSTLVNDGDESQMYFLIVEHSFFQVIQNALVTFDLMESLIFRIEEIKDEKAKSIN